MIKLCGSNSMVCGPKQFGFFQNGPRKQKGWTCMYYIDTLDMHVQIYVKALCKGLKYFIIWRKKSKSFLYWQKTIMLLKKYFFFPLIYIHILKNKINSKFWKLHKNRKTISYENKGTFVYQKLLYRQLHYQGLKTYTCGCIKWHLLMLLK